MFDDKIMECMLKDEKRYLLKGLPIWIIASIDYEPGYWEWQIILKAERN